MKKLVLAMVLLSSTFAFANEEECGVPKESVLCTISSTCEGSYGYYQLRTTFQLVSEINVDGGAQDCTISSDATVTTPAHQKLATLAQQLKSAGVCAFVVDNLQ